MEGKGWVSLPLSGRNWHASKEEGNSHSLVRRNRETPNLEVPGLVLKETDTRAWGMGDCSIRVGLWL